jgi:tRNA(Ile)-lysidine synthase
MLEKFTKNISENFAFLQKSRFCIAVSGGIDSMVLVNLCHQLKLDFAVAHCNFQLRGDESDQDEHFVKLQTEIVKIPIFIQKFDTKSFAKQQKLSIQLVARKLRYEWFNTLLLNNDFDYILTAHHLDDSLETVLINFTRGTGLEGLTGIPKHNGNIVRPLLPFSRNEIEDFAIANSIEWREDSSNKSDNYLRNKLRHKIIPVLKELNSSLLDSFENTISNLQQSQALVNDASQMVYKQVVSEQDTIKIDISKLTAFQNYKAYLYQWLSEYGFTDWNAVYDLIEAQSGKQVFSETHILLKDRNYLILFLKQNDNEAIQILIAKNQIDVKFPLKLSLCNVDDISVNASNGIFVDEDTLQFPLEIRKWRDGDWFYPFGMNGKKKLSKFFKDEKFSLLEKSNAWLLCSDNQIVWVIASRQDERFKVTKTTTKILKINYTT